MKNEERCKFIERTLENNDIESIINCAKTEVELYPVIVPSYKNRYHYMYDYFEENKIKFYVFVYEDDFTASGYDKYQFKYGEIVRITPEDFAQYGMEGKLLGKKRYYIQQYTKIHGIAKYFMIDDDYEPLKCASYVKRREGKSNTDKSKNQILKLDYIDLLKTLQFTFDAYNLSICGSTSRLSLVKYNFDKVFETTHVNGTFLVDNEQLCDNDIYWAKEPIFEDDDITIKIKLAGLTFGRIAFVASDNNGSRLNTVIPYRDILGFNLYKEYPWCTDIRLRYVKELKKWNLIKVFYNSRVTQVDKQYDLEKYNAAKNMSIEEFKQWMADKEGIDMSKPPEEQPKRDNMEKFF